MWQTVSYWGGGTSCDVTFDFNSWGIFVSRSCPGKNESVLECPGNALEFCPGGGVWSLYRPWGTHGASDIHAVWTVGVDQWWLECVGSHKNLLWPLPLLHRVGTTTMFCLFGFVYLYIDHGEHIGQKVSKQCTRWEWTLDTWNSSEIQRNTQGYSTSDRHTNYFEFSMIIMNLSQQYSITNRTEKLRFLENIMIFCQNSSDMSNSYVFGFVESSENVRDWWLFHADILETFWVIQVSNMKKIINIQTCFN